jgi:hypothetical protein
MAEFRLTDRARNNLKSICNDTLTRFGTYQAAAYRAGFERIFGRLEAEYHEIAIIPGGPALLPPGCVDDIDVVGGASTILPEGCTPILVPNHPDYPEPACRWHAYVALCAHSPKYRYWLRKGGAR